MVIKKLTKRTQAATRASVKSKRKVNVENQEEQQNLAISKDHARRLNQKRIRLGVTDPVVDDEVPDLMDKRQTANCWREENSGMSVLLDIASIALDMDTSPGPSSPSSSSSSAQPPGPSSSPSLSAAAVSVRATM